jgi:AcrR family transcriptional regulator
MTDLTPRDERILEAALAEFERHGIKRARVGAIAKNAGVGRATLYRSYPDKDALVTAVLTAKVDLSLAALDQVMIDYETVEDRVVEGFVVMLKSFRNDSLLQRLIALEPESVTPWLTVKGGPILALAREHLAKVMQSADLRLPADLDIEVVAEMAVRLLHSLYATPQGLIGRDDKSSREFVRRYLVSTLFPSTRHSQ